MPDALINGQPLYYEVSGDGPPLLFVNGSGSSIPDVRPLLGLLARSSRVAVADSRGFGGSRLPSAAYSMADLAADAIGLVDLLGWDTFDLLGISFGGMVAQEIAVTVPARIHRLVLMCTSSGGAGGSSYPLHELAALDPQERAARSVLLTDTRFTPEWLGEHAAEHSRLAHLARRQQVSSVEARRATELQLRARAGHDVFDRLPRVSSPTLVASGRFDGIAPPANGAAIAAQIQGAEQRVYEGGHLFFAQDPAAMPDIITFLRAGA